jgi:hypothetical protein
MAVLRCGEPTHNDLALLNFGYGPNTMQHKFENVENCEKRFIQQQQYDLKFAAMNFQKIKTLRHARLG